MADEDLQNDDTDLELEKQLDEGEGEAEGGEGEEPELTEGEEDEGQPQRPQSRASQRVLQFREQARRAQQEADDAKRRLYELEQERAAYTQRNTQQFEQEQLAQMSPEERVDYMLRQARNEQAQFQQQMQFQTNDANDRANFRAMCAEVPAYEKLAPQVENELALIRRNYGWNAPRQLVLATLIGIEAMKQQALTGQKRQAAGQANIQRQKTRPSGGGSDVPRERQGRLDPNSPEARRKRLDGVLI